jgi:hypothetical protein
MAAAGLIQVADVVGTHHRGGIEWYRGWAKEGWTGPSFESRRDGKAAHRVQFSLFWKGPDGQRQLQLRLEYHCGLPEKAKERSEGRKKTISFADQPQEFQSEYLHWKNIFWDRLRLCRTEMKSLRYRLKKEWYFLADRSFDMTTTTYEFIDEVRRMVNVTVPIVDSLLCDREEAPMAPDLK